MTDEFDPLTGELLPKSTRILAQSPPDSGRITEAVDITDKDALRKLALEELVRIVQGNKGDIKGVNACNVLLDRIDGRPGQSIDVSGKVSIVSLVLESYKKNDTPLIDVTSAHSEL